MNSALQPSLSTGQARVANQQPFAILALVTLKRAGKLIHKARVSKGLSRNSCLLYIHY